MQKILLLGGSYAQMPAIIKAKQKGFYVITCDYLPGNPGHKLAHEYYNVSTTNKEDVLSLAKELKIDFIFAYASDPAAPVAAYVADKLGLPGNSYQSVSLLTEKDKFRKFLRVNGFNTPNYISLHPGDNFLEKISSLTLPILIKPTDSSGSKGISRINSFTEVSKAVDYAFSFSRNNRIIAEEFIQCNGPQLHGDGFVHNGNLIFSYLGDHHYNEKINPYVPCATTWPSRKSHFTISNIEKKLGQLIKLSGFENGAINIEARVNDQGEIFFIEIGPRSGGNFVPQILNYATGFDMVDASFDVLEGRFCYREKKQRKNVAYYVIHSQNEGLLEDLVIDKSLSAYITEYHQFIFPGERVFPFQGANAAIGVLLLQFKSTGEMERVIKTMTQFIKVVLS